MYSSRSSRRCRNFCHRHHVRCIRWLWHYGYFRLLARKGPNECQNLWKFTIYNSHSRELTATCKHNKWKFFSCLERLSPPLRNPNPNYRNPDWQMAKDWETIPTIPKEYSGHAQLRSTSIYTTAGELRFRFNTLLTLIYINKAYRAVLSEFQINIMNALPSLVSKIVPMSLIFSDSLEKIWKVVNESQGKSDNRLTLAIPKQEHWLFANLAYYSTY